MKNFIINNKKGIIIIVILLILCIIFKILLSSKHSNSSNILISSYVSNLERNDVDLDNSICDLDNVLKYNNIPYFKLNNNTYQEINKEILTNFLLRTCYQDGFIDYEVSLNDDILSLALNISYDTDDDLAYLEYKTYKKILKLVALGNTAFDIIFGERSQNSTRFSVQNGNSNFKSFEKSVKWA